MRRRLHSVWVGTLFSIVTGASHAGLIGDTVGCANAGGQFVCSPAQATVVAGGSPEFVLAFPLDTPDFSIDVADRSFTVTRIGNLTNLGEDVFVLTSLDLGAPIAGVSFLSAGVSTGTLITSFTGDSVTINWENTRFSDVGSSIRFDLATAAAVPVPGTLALLGFGLAGIVGARRSRAV